MVSDRQLSVMSTRQQSCTYRWTETKLTNKNTISLSSISIFHFLFWVWNSNLHFALLLKKVSHAQISFFFFFVFKVYLPFLLPYVFLVLIRVYSFCPIFQFSNFILAMLKNLIVTIFVSRVCLNCVFKP